MNLLLAAAALSIPFSRADAQQPSQTLSQLQAADAGRPAATTFDGAAAAPALQSIDGSTNPVAGRDDGMLVATPVVSVKPRQVKFETWAADEGGKIGAKWGMIGGGVLGAIGGGIAIALLAHPLGALAAVGVGLGILGLVFGIGALGGWLLGRWMGDKKAKELQASH